MADSRCLILALLPVLLTAPRPVEAGGLSFIGVLREGVGGVDGIVGPLSLAVSPDGASVYVGGNGDNAVAVFSRNVTTGALTFVESQQDGVGGVSGLQAPSHVAVSPDGKNVYVSSEGSDAVAVFSRNGGTGALTFVESKRDGVGGVVGLAGAAGVVVSPDGAHVYVTGAQDNAVTVFSRNATTGALTFVESQQDGVAGVQMMRVPRGVAISPDGANVYVGALNDNSVVVFSRNAGTGALTFVEFHQNLVGGVDGLGGPRSVVVSADGANVYLCTSVDYSVSTWARNAGTGALTFMDFTRKRYGATGLDSCFNVSVSPDGNYFYGEGDDVNEVAVFRRNPTTGALTFVESPKNGTLGIDGLRGVFAVAVSPDSRHLYAVGKRDNAVAAFAVDRCGNGNLGTDEECDDGNLVSGDGCSDTCRLELCGPTPIGGCRKPASVQASLRLANKSPDTRDQLTFAWKGATTTLAEFGNPTTTASYALCVYTGSGPQPAFSLAAPAASSCAGTPCWTIPSTGDRYSYKDPLFTPDGLARVDLKPGVVGARSEIHVKGQGVNLNMPPLPLTLPVTVQVRNTQTSVCWDAVYSASIFNDTARFFAQSDP